MRQVEGRLTERERDALVVNSEGAWAEDRRVRTRFAAHVVVTDEGAT